MVWWDAYSAVGFVMLTQPLESRYDGLIVRLWQLMTTLFGLEIKVVLVEGDDDFLVFSGANHDDRQR